MVQFLVYTGPIGRQKDSEKSLIYSHVARRSHEKRRHDRVHQSKRNEYRNNTIDAGSIHHLPCPTHGTKAYSICINCSALSKDPGPVSLFSGSFDPFQSQGVVRINGEANQYIQFALNNLEFVVESWGYRGFRSPTGFVSSAVVKTGRGVKFDLSGEQFVTDPGVAKAWSTIFTYSSLAYFASCLARITGTETHRQMAEFYAKECYANLESSFILSSGNSLASLDFLVYRVLKFDIALGRYSNATHWANLLKQLFQKKAESQLVNRGLVAISMFQDNSLSLSQWKDPTFDEEWLEGVFRSDWTLAQLPPWPSGYSSDLQALLTASRGLLITVFRSEQMKKNASKGDWCWYLSFSQWLQMKLFRCYRGLERQRKTQNDSTITSLCCCLALCAIYALRHTNQVSVFGTTFDLATANILSHLDEPFNNSSLLIHEAGESADALLYVSFVASLAEWKHQSFKLSGNEKLSTWWRRLLDLIVRRRFTTWLEIEMILERFPYTAHELPLPTSGWLDDALRRTCLIEEVN